MGSAIGAVLPLALGVALSPIPIIAVVLMLATPRGGVNGSSFLLGWLVGLSVVGTIVLLLSGGIRRERRRRPPGSASSASCSGWR